MKKSIQALVLLACLSLAFLFILSNHAKKNDKVKNGFTRNFFSNHAKLLYSIPIENQKYAFANLTKDGITLYKFKKPYELVSFSIDLKNRKDILLPFSSRYHKIDGMNSIALIDSNKFLIVGKSSKVYRIDESQNTIDSNTLDSLYIYQSQTINPNSFLYLSEVNYQGKRRNKLIKANWSGKKMGSYLPEKQFNGLLSTDGQFKYSSDSKLIVFMFYYKGEIVCLDTNLNVLYKKKTIDTVKQVKLLFKQLGKNKTQIAIPPKIVNKRIYVTNNSIFVQSNLKSDNENSKMSNNFEVIDVYILATGDYSFSFYLPKIGKQKLNEFKVYKDNLFVIYPNNLATFKIPKI